MCDQHDIKEEMKQESMKISQTSGKKPPYQLNRRLCGPQNRSELVEKNK